MNNEFIEYDTYDTPAMAPKAAGWPRLMFGGTTRAAADLGDGGKGRFGVGRGV